MALLDAGALDIGAMGNMVPMRVQGAGS